MLGNRAHEGLQPPTNLKERKGHKEAKFAAQVHSAAHPHPLEAAGQSPPHSRAPRRDPRKLLPAPSLRSRVASLPSGKHANSASLEGNRLPSGKRTCSILLEAIPQWKGQTAILSSARTHHTEALNANHSSAAPKSDGVKLPLRTVAATKVLSTNSWAFWSAAARWASRSPVARASSSSSSRMGASRGVT